MPRVRTIVRTDVVTATPDTPVSEIVTLLDQERVGSVVVVEETWPVGIVTDRDLALKVLGAGLDPEETPAGDVMTEDIVTVDAEAGIFEVLTEMSDATVRRIPAVDADGNLAGIVTFDDFVALLGRELEKLGDIVETESPPY